MIPISDKEVRTNAFADLVEVTGRLAQFCNNLEHSEGADRIELLNIGRLLRESAVTTVRASSVKLPDRYADRIAELEARNVLRWDEGVYWPDRIHHAKTWRDVQIAQAGHDATYHPDVVGLPRAEQVRHYTFHLGKLVWKMYHACEDDTTWDSFANSRLIDLVVFGVKLATVANVSLSDLACDDFR